MGIREKLPVNVRVSLPKLKEYTILILILILVFFPTFGYFVGYLSLENVRLIFSIYTPIGFLLLVYVTWLYVGEIREERAEMRKEPVISLIELHFDPLIEELQSRHGNWEMTKQLKTTKSRSFPKTSSIDLSPRFCNELKSHFPELVKELKQYRDLDEEYREI